jgi:hypothetical protein
MVRGQPNAVPATVADVLGDVLIPELGAKMIRRTIVVDDGSELMGADFAAAR